MYPLNSAYSPEERGHGRQAYGKGAGGQKRQIWGGRWGACILGRGGGGVRVESRVSQTKGVGRGMGGVGGFKKKCRHRV